MGLEWEEVGGRFVVHQENSLGVYHPSPPCHCTPPPPPPPMSLPGCPGLALGSPELAPGSPELAPGCPGLGLTGKCPPWLCPSFAS